MQLPARTLWLSRVAAATAAAAALALGATACGSDDDNTGTAASTSAATAPTSAATHDHGDDHDHGETAAAPTAESLQSNLEQITNPDVPVDEKVKLIEDGENRRAILDKLNAALQTYRGIAYQVGEITVDGDTATGKTTITSPSGQSAPPMPMTWEHEDGTWKLSDSSACVLFGFAQIPCAPA